MRKTIKKSSPSIPQLLAVLQKEVKKQCEFVMAGTKTDMFLGLLKSSFAKAYDFARFSNKFKQAQANESAFLMTAGLRGICEDIIALKFIGHLATDLRRELILLEMVRSLRHATEVQANFFNHQRPFQPILNGKAQSLIERQSEKAKYTDIGIRAGLTSIKDKLPPVEQMALKVGLKEIYDFFYRVTSETVHFNVRVALRNGWGPIPEHVHFGTRNFCRYYLFVNQVYGVFLFCLMCETFEAELKLTPKFMLAINNLKKCLDEMLRWPEPVTFEEMNIEGPNEIMRIVLRMAHLDDLEKKAALATSPKI